MNIHYPKIAKLLTMIFITLVGLAIAGFFGFNFSLDIFFGFKIFLILFLIYFVCELLKNKKEVEAWLSNQSYDKKLNLWGVIKLVFSLIFSKYLFLSICMIGIYYEIFFLTGFSDSLVLFLLIFWLLTAKKFSFNSQVSAGVAIFFLALTPFYLISQKELLAEKSANWAYMFLVATVIQFWRESRKETGDNTSGINLDKVKKSLLKIGEFIVRIDS